MFFSNIVQFVIDSIHDSTLFVVPCIAIVYPFRKTFFKADKQLLIAALNIALLFASILYALLLVTEIGAAYFSAGEYLQYTFGNRFFGSFWLYASIMFFNYVLLPQIFWFKKMRMSIVWSLIVVGAWIIVYALSVIILVYIKPVDFSMNNSRTTANMVKELGTYFVVVVVIYLILKGKELNKLKTSSLERF